MEFCSYEYLILDYSGCLGVWASKQALLFVTIARQKCWNIWRCNIPVQWIIYCGTIELQTDVVDGGTSYVDIYYTEIRQNVAGGGVSCTSFCSFSTLMWSWSAVLCSYLDMQSMWLHFLIFLLNIFYALILIGRITRTSVTGVGSIYKCCQLWNFTI